LAGSNVGRAPLPVYRSQTDATSTKRQRVDPREFLSNRWRFVLLTARLDRLEACPTTAKKTTTKRKKGTSKARPLFTFLHRQIAFLNIGTFRACKVRRPEHRCSRPVPG
jgi:hypothetical protein